MVESSWFQSDVSMEIRSGLFSVCVCVFLPESIVPLSAKSHSICMCSCSLHVSFQGLAAATALMDG